MVGRSHYKLSFLASQNKCLECENGGGKHSTKHAKSYKTEVAHSIKTSGSQLMKLLQAIRADSTPMKVVKIFRLSNVTKDTLYIHKTPWCILLNDYCNTL